jgi:hypothetical protein
MAQGNIGLAHEVIDAVERRDLGRLVELSDPEVDWRSAFAIGGRYRGHAGLRNYVSDMNDAWEIVRLDVDHEFGIEDIVLFIGRIHYRGRGSGVEAESQSGYVLKFRAKKLLLFRPFQDPVRALEAVGL